MTQRTSRSIMRLTLVSFAMLLGTACSGSAKGAIDGGLHDDAATDAAGDATGSPDAPSCDMPPAGVCLDATTLQLSRGPGVLTAGTCVFETSTSSCPFGCADGGCNAQACTPQCTTATCGDDGCGGTCGPCTSGTTFPALSATPLGIARNMEVSPDGTHVAAVRAPLSFGCGQYGTLDVWTVPDSGVATHRTIGAHVAESGARFSENNSLVYIDKPDPCAIVEDLWIARADGSGAHHIGATREGFGFQIIKNTLLYTAPDPSGAGPGDSLVYAVRLPDGAPRRLARVQSNLRTSSFWIASPTGEAVWLSYDQDAGDLAIYGVDGTSSQLATSAAITNIGRFGCAPTWSPDGKKLAYVDNANLASALHAINADGTADTTLGTISCGGTTRGTSIAWAADASRVAWVENAPSSGLDARVHTISGGADVTLRGVLSATQGGELIRLAFSADSARLYALAGADARGFNLLSAPTARSGDMSLLAPSQVQESWVESRDGSVLASPSLDATRVIALGGATQTITGAGGGARLEPITSDPRWLIQHGPQLSVYPLSGAGAGTPLPTFETDAGVSSWASLGNIPFVFGWSGSTALFPAAPKQFPGAPNRIATVTQDLMAWTTAATGRLGTLVTHYRAPSGTSRIYFTTLDDGLFWVPRP